MKSAGDWEQQAIVARHYVNPDDERQIKGAAENELDGFYEREESKVGDSGGILQNNPSNAILKNGFDQVDEDDI